jgi:hypothetical protein
MADRSRKGKGTDDQREEIMSVFLDFFAVRPVFTLYGLRVLWGAYIIARALPFVSILSNPNLSTASITPLLALFLQASLEIAMFRLLIEVAAAVLLGRPRPESSSAGCAIAARRRRNGNDRIHSS